LFPLSFLIFACAHPSRVSLPENMTCEDLPPFQSYHIHVHFWQKNKDSVAGALALRSRFISEFGVSESLPCDDSHLGQPTYLCMLDVDYEPTAPFLTSEWAVFVPVGLFSVTVPWIMSHRGQYDVLVHPTSGCEIEDHRDWSFWCGNKWELDLSIMSWNCAGCDGFYCAGKAQELILPGSSGTCGLSLTTPGGLFKLTDKAAYCTATCQGWVMQVEKLFSDCRFVCDVVEELLKPTQQDIDLCNSYNTSLDLFQQYSALC